MSHSSGISVSPSLLSAFAETSRSSGHRFLKVTISNESLLDLVQTVDPVREWERDFDLVPPTLTEKDASYILFRTDIKNENNIYLWYLLCYVPDKCKVRDKMVYASSRANLKSGLGSAGIIDEIFGTHPADFSCAGFEAWKKHQEADIPLTEFEQQKNEELEQGVFKGGAGTSTAYVHGVAFPVDGEVFNVIEKFKAETVNYIQIGIDTENEKIILKDSGNFEIEEVTSRFPNNEPRFHFYRWTHNFEGDIVKSIVYCYSCPSSPVKLRMLYSASKANVASVVEQRGIVVDTKLEITNPNEFNSTDLNVQIHPPKAEAKKTFAKPKPAGGRKLISNKQ